MAREFFQHQFWGCLNSLIGSVPHHQTIISNRRWMFKCLQSGSGFKKASGCHGATYQKPSLCFCTSWPDMLSTGEGRGAEEVVYVPFFPLFFPPPAEEVSFPPLCVCVCVFWQMGSQQPSIAAKMKRTCNDSSRFTFSFWKSRKNSHFSLSSLCGERSFLHPRNTPLFNHLLTAEERTITHWVFS